MGNRGLLLRPAPKKKLLANGPVEAAPAASIRSPSTTSTLYPAVASVGKKKRKAIRTSDLAWHLDALRPRALKAPHMIRVKMRYRKRIHRSHPETPFSGIGGQGQPLRAIS